jgi:hypothetical protein
MLKRGGAMKPTAHQCPYCELRFALYHEVQDHILRDHPDKARVAETAQIVELPP